MELVVLFSVLSVVVGCIGVWALLELRKLNKEEAEREAQKAKEGEKL